MSEIKGEYNCNSESTDIFDQGNFQNSSNVCHNAYPVTSYKDFFKKIKYHDKEIIKGILIYTDEDTELKEYIEKYFQDFHKLSGKWCKIFILEKPSRAWIKENLSLAEQFKFIGNIKKSEVYDIARELKINLNQIPCLIFFGEEINSQSLIIPIHHVSVNYFREVFTKLEEIIYNVCAQTNYLPDMSPFDAISYHFDEIIKYLDKFALLLGSQRLYSYQQQLIITEKFVMEDKSINLPNSQIDGSFINAETVNSQTIGGSIIRE